MKRLSLVAACIWFMPLFAASQSFGEAVKEYTDPTSGIRFVHVAGGCFTCPSANGVNKGCPH